MTEALSDEVINKVVCLCSSLLADKYEDASIPAIELSARQADGALADVNDG